MWKDFKAFLAKGNILDLAIAVIIGAAFAAVIKTFTDGIVMPFISLLTGKIDFKEKVWNLGDMPVSTPEQIDAAIKAKEPLVMYGLFINDLINFIIVGFIMFLLARYAIKLFKGLEAEAAPAGPSNEEVLLAEIRDLLKENNSK